MTTLVCLALPEEAAALQPKIANLRPSTEFLVTGPGKLRAATALALRLAPATAPPRVEHVLNVGTAGWVGYGAIPTGPIEIEYIIEHDFDNEAIEQLTGRSYATAIQLQSESGYVLATGDSFIQSFATASRLERHGAHLVDMEAYALAHVCKATRYNLPFSCVKWASDRAGNGAPSDWRASVDVIAEQIATYVLERVPNA